MHTFLLLTVTTFLRKRYTNPTETKLKDLKEELKKENPISIYTSKKRSKKLEKM